MTVTIKGSNDNPTALDDNQAVYEDSATFITGQLVDDPDASDTLATLTVDTSVTQGTVTYNDTDGTFSYDAGSEFNDLDQGETSTDTFMYHVNDDLGAIAIGTVTVTIKGENDNPTALGDSQTVDEDSATFTTAQLVGDPDASDTLTVVVTSATQGTVTYNDADGTFSYDAGNTFDYLNDGQTATDTFTYTVSDNNGGTDTATVTITITGVSPPPPPDDPGTPDDLGAPDDPNTPVDPNQPTTQPLPEPTTPTGVTTSAGDANDGIGNTDSTPGYDSSYETGSSPDFDAGTPDDLTLGDDLIADLDFNSFLSDMNDDTRFTIFTEPWQNYTSPVIVFFGESFPTVGIEDFPDGEYDVNWGGAYYAGLDWNFVHSLGHIPDGEYGVTPNDALGPLEDAEADEDEFQNLLAGNMDYSQMADLDELFDRHDSFKSDIDRILDSFASV